jgi:hypothetical protein
LQNSVDRNAQTAALGSQQPLGDRSEVSAPTLSLPKGGGAIRGMGEKFAAHPVTSIGSMTAHNRGASPNFPAGVETQQDFTEGEEVVGGSVVHESLGWESVGKLGEDAPVMACSLSSLFGRS